MGTPSGIAAIGMGDKKNITMPTKSTAGSWSHSSATASASASASPIYTGAAQKMSGNIACVVAGLCAAAALL